MTTITKERLLAIRQWRETYGPGSNVVLSAEEAEELARIALASLEAEPVGEFYEYKPGDWYQRSVGDKAPKWVPLYAAPPAPCNPVSELTLWVKRLAHALKHADSLSSLPDKAIEYLKQNALIKPGDSLR